MPKPSTIDIDKMYTSAGEAASVLRSLAHQDRLLMLCQLSQEELCVSEIEERLGIRQPNLSQQLAVLRKQGLVSTRRQGTHIYYQVSDARVLAVLQTLYENFCQQ